jgi:long-chain-fatty-acid--CoA ligase ACSBG
MYFIKSGTTGSQKAVMISHDNITYTARYIGIEQANLKFFKEKIISYLPLSHIAAQIIDLHLGLAIGSTVYFAQPDALKGTLLSTMTEVKPTFFFGVPRVWEKFQEKIQAIFQKQSVLKAQVLKWSRTQASNKVGVTFYGYDPINSASYSIAKALLLKNIKKALGLSECDYMFSGAAPIRRDTLEFFISLGIPLCEVFGMSELTGPHTIGFKYANRITSVGYCLNSRNRSKLIDTGKNTTI